MLVFLTVRFFAFFLFFSIFAMCFVYLVSLVTRFFSMFLFDRRVSGQRLKPRENEVPIMKTCKNSMEKSVLKLFSPSFFLGVAYFFFSFSFLFFDVASYVTSGVRQGCLRLLFQVPRALCFCSFKVVCFV